MDRRDELRAWMHAVIDRTGKSARQWALSCGLAPTTVTRFLSNDEASFPTYDTLAKLVEKAPADLPVPGLAPKGEGVAGHDDIEMLRRLPERKRRLVSDMIRALIDDEHPDTPPPARAAGE